MNEFSRPVQTKMGSRIANLAVYCPDLVLPEDVICSAYAKDPPKQPSVRRVANFDEDEITLAYRAASDCLSEVKETPDHIILCSTTLSAGAGTSFLLASLNLPLSTNVTLLSGSWRCALDVLPLAALLASQGKKVLLIASEMLSRYSFSSPSLPFADAGAAAWISPSADPYLFEITDHSCVSDTFEPLIRNDDGLQVFEDMRFSITKISEILGRALSGMERPQSLAFSLFDDKLAKAVIRIPQVGKVRIVEDPVTRIGFAGCVQPFLLLLSAVLEPGATVHLAAYGAGASVISLRAGSRKPTESRVSREIRIKGFEQFREIREFLHKSESMRAAFTSQAILSRDQDFLIGLQGVVCADCGRIFTIPQTVCPGCGKEGKLNRTPLSRSGTVFTFTHEYYIPTPAPPVTMVVVDLDGGGRVTVQATDCLPEEITVGTRVRLVLRRYHAGGGLPNYYWKAVIA